MRAPSRYRLLAELGRGGMGVVWRAHDERLDREVAVKIVHDWVAEDPALRSRFEREAAALARLQHPHVVRLYDVDEADGRTLLVMELIEGDSLEALAANRRLTWAETRAACAPVAAALAYAHARGVVHRDLNPANVLVERSSGRVVVSDFGLARLTRTGGTATVPGLLAGTPEYWSPEQAAGRDSGPETDLYALGCMLYRLRSGRVPFEGEDRLAAGLRRLHEDAPPLRNVPPEARELVAELLDRDPGGRPSATETARRLGAAQRTISEAAPTLVDRDALTLPAVTFAQPSAHRAGRRRMRVVALVAAVLGALVGGGVYAVASMDPPGIPAPAVVGDSLADARAEVTAAADEANVDEPVVQVIGRAYSEDVDAGLVLAQDPAPGSHVPETGVLGVRLSLGSAWAAVPEVTGLPTREAIRALSEAGFTPVRRYGPSLGTTAWHATATAPAAGSRLRRPAKVSVFVSTGPPKAPIPSVVGEGVDDALDAIEDAGFATSVEESASAEEAGTVVAVRPRPGTRVPVGSTVTVVVAREPRWEAVQSFDGDDTASTDAIAVPAGARVVVHAENTSFLGILDGWVGVGWTGDDEGTTEIDSGHAAIVVEPADADRSVAFTLEPHGSVRWKLVVEAVG
jgi:beta-lactam-binding protein with PASTA domain/predicted Ser/Thr protein kinase